MKRLLALAGVAALAFAVTPAGASDSGNDPRAETRSGNATACSDIGVTADATLSADGAQNNADAYVSGVVSDGADNPGAVLDVTASSAVVVKAVVVKGGDGYNVYWQNVPGMTSPLNDGGKVPTISHWFVCYDVVHPVTGSITVTKAVSGSLAPSDDVFYAVELRDGSGASVGTQFVEAGHSVTWDGLAAGSYTLHEAGDSSYTDVWWPSSTVVIDGDHHDRSVTLTNDYGNGSITLTKTVEGEVAPHGAAFSFLLVAQDSAEVQSASLDVRVLHAGESTTWDGLAAGTYRIVELTKDVNGQTFTTTWSPSDLVVISSSHRHEDVLATNDFGERHTGYVTVTKQVTGGLAPEGARYELRLERQDDGGWVEVGPSQSVAAGESASWYGLAHGTYRVVEVTEGSFATTWSPDDVVVLDDLHESAALTVTNAYGNPTGSVTVHKVTTGSLAPTGAMFEVTLFRVTDDGTTAIGRHDVQAGEDTTWTGLPYGSYRVVETPAAGATTSYAPSADVVVGAGSPAVTVVVTNAYGDAVTRTTTTEPTTTTTQPTTTTAAPTTTATPSTETPSTSEVSNESLAFTGSDTLLVAGIGLAAAALGFGLVLVSRRRSVS